MSYSRDRRSPAAHSRRERCQPQLHRLYCPSHKVERCGVIADPSKQTSTSSDTTTTSGNIVKETTAAGGQVKTITVPAAGATSGLDSSSASTSKTGGSKLSGGSIAGIVIGVIGGLALVGALIFLVFFYRKRARAASPDPSQDMADNRTSQGSSFVRGVFPQGHVHDLAGSSTLGRKQTFTDNRLKSDIYPNGPRESSASLQDNEDYSRPVLRVSDSLTIDLPSYTNRLASSPTRTRSESGYNPIFLPPPDTIDLPIHSARIPPNLSVMIPNCHLNSFLLFQVVAVGNSETSNEKQKPNRSRVSTMPSPTFQKLA